MSASAQVHSIDLLKRFHAVLTRFGVDAQTALGSAGMELIRVENTIVERLKYWQQQAIKRQEEVAQARSALSHARALAESRRTGCVEQELALRKAQERLREAEGKVVTTKRWLRDLPECVKEYEGPARSLSGFLEADLRQALVLLENKIATLEAYLAIAASHDTARPTTQPASIAPTPAPDAGTKEETRESP
jgi:hypothetical protein